MELPDVTHFYEVMREVNPWLPDADYVSGNPGMSLEMGINKLPVLRLEVFVALPSMMTGTGLHEFYEMQAKHGEQVPEEAPEDTKKSQEFSTDEVW